ncbi:hypothetical protein Q1695_010653 [Nippostrongylus brasiliensis]|nr:hypothetical protein Q1695_010653 [Nippostrongylus brasiliensis]
MLARRNRIVAKPNLGKAAKTGSAASSGARASLTDPEIESTSATNSQQDVAADVMSKLLGSAPETTNETVQECPSAPTVDVEDATAPPNEETSTSYVDPLSPAKRVAHTRTVSDMPDSIISTIPTDYYVPKLPRPRRKFTGEEELDPKKMRMMDMIYWNPKKEKGMTKRHVETESVIADERKAPSVDLQSSSTSKVAAPQVTIGPDGRLVIDEKSLVIPEKGGEETSVWETVDEDRVSRRVTSLSFRTRLWRKGSPWSEKETELFYEILRCTGPDFGLMHEFFPSRARNELKSKYNREERTNWRKMSEIMSRPTLLADDLYERAAAMQKEIEEEALAKKLKKRKERKKQRKLKVQEPEDPMEAKLRRIKRKLMKEANKQWDESTADLVGEAADLIRQLEREWSKRKKSRRSSDSSSSDSNTSDEDEPRHTIVEPTTEIRKSTRIKKLSAQAQKLYEEANAGDPQASEEEQENPPAPTGAEAFDGYDEESGDQSDDGDEIDLSNVASSSKYLVRERRIATIIKTSTPIPRPNRSTPSGTAGNTPQPTSTSNSPTPDIPTRASSENKSSDRAGTDSTSDSTDTSAEETEYDDQTHEESHPTASLTTLSMEDSRSSRRLVVFRKNRTDDVAPYRNPADGRVSGSSDDAGSGGPGVEPRGQAEERRETMSPNQNSPDLSTSQRKKRLNSISKPSPSERKSKGADVAHSGDSTVFHASDTSDGAQGEKPDDTSREEVDEVEETVPAQQSSPSLSKPQRNKRSKSPTSKHSPLERKTKKAKTEAGSKLTNVESGDLAVSSPPESTESAIDGEQSTESPTPIQTGQSDPSPSSPLQRKKPRKALLVKPSANLIEKARGVRRQPSCLPKTKPAVLNVTESVNDEEELSLFSSAVTIPSSSSIDSPSSTTPPPKTRTPASKKTASKAKNSKVEHTSATKVCNGNATLHPIEILQMDVYRGARMMPEVEDQAWNLVGKPKNGERQCLQIRTVLICQLLSERNGGEQSTESPTPIQTGQSDPSPSSPLQRKKPRKALLVKPSANLIEKARGVRRQPSCLPKTKPAVLNVTESVNGLKNSKVEHTSATKVCNGNADDVSTQHSGVTESEVSVAAKKSAPSSKAQKSTPVPVERKKRSKAPTVGSKTKLERSESSNEKISTRNEDSTPIEITLDDGDQPNVSNCGVQGNISAESHVDVEMGTSERDGSASQPNDSGDGTADDGVLRTRASKPPEEVVLKRDRRYAARARASLRARR